VAGQAITTFEKTIMKTVSLFFLSFIFFASASLGSTLTMCPNGGVKNGDSIEDVERKCGKASSSSMTSFRLEGKSHMLATKKVVFKDGTEIMFIFVDRKVVSSQILN
jgi:hypothetical protein